MHWNARVTNAGSSSEDLRMIGDAIKHAFSLAHPGAFYLTNCCKVSAASDCSSGGLNRAKLVPWNRLAPKSFPVPEDP